MSYKDIKQELDDEPINELKKRIRAATEDFVPPKRGSGIIAIRFGQQELDFMVMDIIDAYRKKHGYTWKTLFVRAIAEMSANEGNSALAETMVDYMINRKNLK